MAIGIKQRSTSPLTNSKLTGQKVFFKVSTSQAVSTANISFSQHQQNARVPKARNLLYK